jgi:flagellin
MALRITNNVASLNAQRQINRSNAGLGRALERLSSGFRINRAGDDAAGLAISEKLRANVRALGQASRNASDGISMIQTAEGGMDEVNNMLVRMKELAEQSANGTLSDDERGFLSSEYKALFDECQHPDRHFRRYDRYAQRGDQRCRRRGLVPDLDDFECRQRPERSDQCH